MKIKSILLSATIFAFVGCGGTGADTNPELGGEEQQGAMGNYNNTFGNQNIAGIWNIYRVESRNGQTTVNRNQPSIKFELDDRGNLYNVPVNGAQKEQVTTYKLVSNQELKISTQSGMIVAEYLSADQQDNNCFYTKSTVNRQSTNELWCKGGVVQQEPDVKGPVPFQDYLFPYDTITTGIHIAENIHVYEDNQQIRYLGSYEKGFNKFISNNNSTQIVENHDKRKYRTYEMHTNQISSFDEHDRSDGEYPTQVSAGDTLPTFSANGVDLTCRVENITYGIDLSSLLPSTIQQNFETQSDSHYYSYNKSNSLTYTNKTIHVHCDASNGYTLDEYYVDAWGNVLTISRDNDGTSRYEILDKLSIQH